MDLKTLDAFRAIARQGTLGRAAVLHGLTLPAMSIRLKKLEAELGVQLFDHRPKKLTLTKRGQIFLKEIDRMFDALDRAKAAIANPLDEYVGNVSVSISTDIAKIFAPNLAQFVRLHPNLNVMILARPSRESIARVTSGEIDIGVGFFNNVPRGIAKKKLCETDISLVVPRGHPLSKPQRPTLAEIAAHRVVMLQGVSATKRMIRSVFSKNAINLPNVLEVERCQSAMDFVELGLGVGLVHSICGCAEPHKKLVQVNMSRYFDKADVALIMRSNMALSSAHQALIQTFVRNSAVARLNQGNSRE